MHKAAIRKSSRLKRSVRGELMAIGHKLDGMISHAESIEAQAKDQSDQLAAGSERSLVLHCQYVHLH